MSQILKLKDGDQVKTKKQQDLDQIAANKQKIQDAYDSGNLSEEAKAQLDMISRNAQSYLEADPLHNRNARKFQLELTNRMADIVDGKQGYTPYETEVAEKNFFDRYSDNEMGLIANELVRQTLTGGGSGTSVSGGQPVSEVSGAPVDLHHVYNWLGGQDLSLLAANATTKQKVGYIIDGLAKGIADVERASNAGKMLHGFDSADLEAAKSKLNELGVIKAKLANPDYTDDDAFRDLNNLLVRSNDIFKIPADTFKSLFSKYYTEQNEETASQQPVIYKDQMLTDYLTKNKGLKLYKTEDGKYILKDASGQHAAENFAETNPQSQYYQWGFFIDPTTGEILGADNLNNPEFVSKFSEQWAALAPKIREEYKSKFPIIDYTTQGGRRGIDLSHHLPGSDVVFIDGDKLKAWENGTDAWMPFDQWVPNWDQIKSQFNYTGNADITTSGNDTKNQYRDSKGFIDDPKFSEILASIEDLSNEDLNQLSGKIKGTGRISDDSAEKMLESPYQQAESWNIETKIAAFVGYCLLGEYDRLNKLFPNNTKETNLMVDGKPIQLGDAFMIRLKENKDLYKKVLKMLLKTRIGDEEKTIALKKAVREELNKVDSYKQGGVFKHVTGTFKGGVQKTTAQSDNGQSSEISDWSNLSGRDKTIIALTGASILNDLVSVGTAHIPVAGPWISGAQAIAGMGVDLATDIMSGASAGETAKNAALSGATGAAGLLVGSAKLAKAGLWANRIRRIVRDTLGIMNLGNMASRFADKDTQEAWKKLANPSELTVKDWVNIGRSLRAIANTAVSASSINRARTDARTTTVNPKQKLIVQQSKANPKEKVYKQVTTEQIDKAGETDSKWKFVSNYKQRAKQSQELADEGYETVVGLRGTPRTREVRQFDTEAQAARQAQSDRFTPEAQKKAFGYEGYQAGPKSGEKAKEWDFNLEKLSFNTTIKPTVVNKAKYNGKEVKIYGVRREDFDNGKVAKQIAPDLTKTSKVGLPKSVIEALPKGSEEIYYSRKNGNFVFISEPKSNKNGGKLDRLHKYINNK